FCIGHSRFIWCGEEERDSSDRSHEQPARERYGAPGSDHAGQPRSSATDPDDDARPGGWNVTFGAWYRSRSRGATFNRDCGYWWPVTIAAADVDSNAGRVFIAG